MSAVTFEDMDGNLLLAKLREADRRRLLPHFAAVELGARDFLHRAGDEVVDTWFPCGAAMASFNVWVDDGNAGVEVALVGREGAVGGIVSNGFVPAFSTSQVRYGGRFLRIKTVALEQAKADSLPLRHWFARYADCLLAQAFQSAACNATHSIMQRTAKWLLAASARTGKLEFELTQDQLAHMLGVGRTFVTRIVKQLRDDGLIATRRGVFVVTNEPALRAISCGCAATVGDHCERVLGGIYPQG